MSTTKMQSDHSGFCWVSLVFADLLVLLLFVSVLLLDLLNALSNSFFVLSFHFFLCCCCFRFVHLHICFRKGKGEKITRVRRKNQVRMLLGKGVVGKLCSLHGFALGRSGG